MTQHLVRFGMGRNVAQQSCLWCREPQATRSTRPCLDQEARDAIVEFARTHGRSWRAALLTLWQSPSCPGPLLRVRHKLGPSGLRGWTPPVQG